MKTFWVKDCKDEQSKKDRLQKLANAQEILDVFKERLSENVRTIQKRRLAETTFETNEWALQQAYFNAEEKTYLKIMELLDNRS